MSTTRTSGSDRPTTAPARLKQSTEPRRDPLLDLPQAADYLGVRPRMVRRLVAERRIPFTRVGRHIRLRQSDLDSYLAERYVAAVTR